MSDGEKRGLFSRLFGGRQPKTPEPAAPPPPETPAAIEPTPAVAPVPPTLAEPPQPVPPPVVASLPEPTAAPAEPSPVGPEPSPAPSTSVADMPVPAPVVPEPPVAEPLAPVSAEAAPPVAPIAEEPIVVPPVADGTAMDAPAAEPSPVAPEPAVVPAAEPIVPISAEAFPLVVPVGSPTAVPIVEGSVVEGPVEEAPQGEPSPVVSEPPAAATAAPAAPGPAEPAPPTASVEPPPVAVPEPPAAPVPEEPPSAPIAPAAAEAPTPAPLEITPAVPLPPAAKKLGWWQKLKSGLSRTSSALGSGITAIFTKRKLDDETLEELEDILIQADLGLATAIEITDALRRDRFDKEISDREVRTVLAAEVRKVLEPVARPLVIGAAHRPHVVLVVGVNGSGKTTTIGKLAMKLTREGRSVMLCAGDTFRAAAIDQLKIWASRTGASVVAREPGADAAGLAFDALTAAREQRTEVLVIDTAGRLQNRTELMAELEKVIRVLKKQDPTAPHDVILTLDATTGQNALNQVEIFGKVAGVTGLVMTKLDGTARGGILVAVAERFGLPVHFIGVGEGADDLEPFDAADFAGAIAGLERSEG